MAVISPSDLLGNSIEIAGTGVYNILRTRDGQFLKARTVCVIESFSLPMTLGLHLILHETGERIGKAKLIDAKTCKGLFVHSIKNEGKGMYKGVGTALLHTVIRISRELGLGGRVELESIQAAEKFYAKRGFRIQRMERGLRSTQRMVLSNKKAIREFGQYLYNK